MSDTASPTSSWTGSGTPPARRRLGTGGTSVRTSARFGSRVDVLAISESCSPLLVGFGRRRSRRD